MLAPPTYLWHRATVPAELGFVVQTTGSFGFACTVYCGYGHPYMVEPGRVVVGSA
jgi:heme/copper-type cytochrome/quinol oxidase subunit 2